MTKVKVFVYGRRRRQRRRRWGYDNSSPDFRHGELKKDEEQRLIDWCLHMARIGYGRTRGEFLDVVQRIIQKDERPTPFKDSRPGKDWYYQFLKRHPELVEKETNELGKERALVSSAKVQHKIKYILYLLLMN